MRDAEVFDAIHHTYMSDLLDLDRRGKRRRAAAEAMVIGHGALRPLLKRAAEGTNDRPEESGEDGSGCARHLPFPTGPLLKGERAAASPIVGTEGVVGL